MTDETRRRQMRDKLMARAKKMQEADQSRRIAIIEKIIESRRNNRRPYSPERRKAQLRDLFGGKRHEAVIGK